MRRAARTTYLPSARRRAGRLVRVRERLAVFALALAVLAAIVGLAFAAGYIVGKLIL